MTQNEFLKKIKSIIDDEGINITMKDLRIINNIIYKSIISILKSNDTVKLNGITYSLKNVPEKSGITKVGKNKGKRWIKPAHKKLCVKLSPSLQNEFKENTQKIY